MYSRVSCSVCTFCVLGYMCCCCCCLSPTLLRESTQNACRLMFAAVESLGLSLMDQKKLEVRKFKTKEWISEPVRIYFLFIRIHWLIQKNLSMPVMREVGSYHGLSAPSSSSCSPMGCTLHKITSRFTCLSGVLHTYSMWPGVMWFQEVYSTVSVIHRLLEYLPGEKRDNT